MVKVQLYRTLNGQRQWQKGAALLPGVQDALRAEAEQVLARAQARLQAHRSPDNPMPNIHLKRESGRVDEYVSMYATSGGMAAVLSAEFGHDPYMQYRSDRDYFQYVGGSKPTNILRGGAGLAR